MSGTEVVGQMDLSCTDHVSLHPAGAPGGGWAGSQKGGCPTETLALSPAQPWPAPISVAPLPLSPIPPSPPHPAKHPKRWPSPQGSGQPPGLTMAQTTSWSMGRPCQMSVPGMDSCRKCNSTAPMQLCIQDLAAMLTYFHLSDGLLHRSV